MKVLLFISCAFAVASASYAPLYHHQAVLGLDGHPVETPEVQHARAAHYAAHAEALARVGHGIPYGPAAHYGIVPGAVSLDGRPLDTPVVAAAKLQHYHDYAVAAAKNGVAVGHGLVLGHVAGVHPIDTPEVQHAKAAHFAAHAEASARAHGLVHLRRRRGIYAYPQHIPLIDARGVPVDTPAVQAARAHHLAAHAEASLKSGHLAYVPYHDVSPVVYAAPHHFGAVLGLDGHPVDTPEVQHAKAAHFAAHAAAHHHLY
ncbi:hypothetical protein WA026_006939 [Henosepilachna vigintioctopunctata]|uniref:Uncharacterized protein n=1 Tax=Henosepilachna vigintioctopunctata TaxID=420089 RepID=A0AAW1VC26_9CUCU